MSEKSVQYSCRILPLGNWPSIGIAFNIGMLFLFGGIGAGLPVWLILALMLGAMYGLFYWMTTPATFVIQDSTISRTLDTSSFLFREESPKSYTWKDIRSFKNGTDRGRYRGEYQFLEIRFRDGKNWTMTDDYGARKAAYNPFLEVFLEEVQAYNNMKRRTAVPAPAAVFSHPISSLSTELPGGIEREKTFYETFAAKLLTVFFFLVTAGLITFFIQNPSYLTGTSLFKILMVLIPGVAYMAGRTLFKKEKK